jgi:hypothetical protein
MKKSDLPTKVCPVCDRPVYVARQVEAQLGVGRVLLEALLWAALYAQTKNKLTS